MRPPPHRSSATTTTVAALLLLSILTTTNLLVSARTITVGASSSSSSSPVGWTDGICYRPISHVLPGDVIRFSYTNHDVHKMASESHWTECDFADAIQLAEVGQSPYEYTVTRQDAVDGTIYFACGVGAHCSSGPGQRVRVNVDARDGQLGTGPDPVSEWMMGVGAEGCRSVQNGELPTEDGAGAGSAASRSECTAPIAQPDGRYFVTCLSSPATLTPGGVINEFRLLHNPYPTDRRVKVGLRTWEFVSGDPIPDPSGDPTIPPGGVVPVPVNQLYVHHLSGSVVLGQGSEGIRRSEPDAPYPEPYGLLTGDEGDTMGFHLIDLREVGDDDWLECIECRCADGVGTYLDYPANVTRNEYGVATEGGVPCCTNCTALTSPTVDYRMRYNVSYSDVPRDGPPVAELLMVTADVSPAVGKSFEFDVPQFQHLPAYQRKDGHVQRLERIGPFNELFRMDFFGDPYDGPDTVRILRCVGHLHVAAVGMWLEDAQTGQTICANVGTHGTDPATDKGFLTAVSVENHYDNDDDERPAVEFPADRSVRLVTEYDATVLHTGVMGMWFVFVDGENDISRDDADLNVDFCHLPTCDASLVPDVVLEEKETCFNALPDSPACKYASVCDCEEFVNAPQSTGCGGTYAAAGIGDIPVNDMCHEYCGCPDDDQAPGGGGGPACEDVLDKTPACQFGNLCDCEELVNHPDSPGCGGVLTSEMGDIFIDDFCPKYCDACPDGGGGSRALLEESIVEQIEESLLETCRYATDHCRLVLSNLYSCSRPYCFGPDDAAPAATAAAVTPKSASGQQESDEESSSEEATMDPIVKAVLKKHGERLAVKHSKLGHPSLHANDEEEREVKACDGSNVVPCPSSIGLSPHYDHGASGAAAKYNLYAFTVVSVYIGISFILSV